MTVASPSTSEGLLQGLSASVTLFGIIAFCLAAATFAGEYGTGTIRAMLLREPRRIPYAVGAWAALGSLLLVTVLMAAAGAAVLAVLLAPGQGVDTASWFSAEGVATSGRTVVLAAVAFIGYATLGSALGVLLRAAIPAVVIGIGWLFLLETIVAGSAPDVGQWLPGQFLSAVAADGTGQIGLAAALVTA